MQIYATEETVIVSIHNFPFLETLGVKPYRSVFETKIIKDNIDNERIKKIIIPSQSKKKNIHGKRYFFYINIKFV